MIAISSYQSIKDLLHEELATRCGKNARYSLRAFSRDLGISAQRLSSILNGKRGISKNAALEIAKKLHLTEDEMTTFLHLAESEFSRSKQMKAVAKIRLDALRTQHKQVDPSIFKTISQWYHMAILALLETETKFNSPDEVSKRLSITPFEAKSALNRLLDLKMIEADESGFFRITGFFFAEGVNIPSSSIKTFHESMLEKAAKNIHFQGLDERDYSTLFMAIDPAQIPEMKKFIREFRTKFDQTFSNSKTRKTEVYTIGIQLHRVT